ncbi:baseplate J-like protein [Tenacibaculum skagerrakense]|uniref:Baseplate J-like protein n=1 Tax=Tenacibaculum skagerrakense TaxID=186571 RepID=A0A4R2NQB2_9FLAO|nr:baseplate J/gp47 family protein [Tenacibaculum skagerrakense]TCP24039.1 baseplate J-like protein [Tenacibaculum skagerrakense]
MSKIIPNILTRNGTGQEQRFIQALDPENFELHDFTIEDWILFAYNFSKNVNYFSTKDYEVVAGDWKNFFKQLTTEEIPYRGTREYDKLKESVAKNLAEMSKDAKVTAHLTLFICFLNLLELSKERFNQLTKRHLDFYYKEILQVDKREPIADQAHVLFELAKKVTDQQIVEGTALDAKKDALGNPLVYKTTEELIANKTTVSQLKTLYNSNTEEVKKIKVSNNVKTKDGLEEPLEEGKPYWYPFGYPETAKNVDELPDAKLGFSIASPMLFLKEGLRTVTITFNFDDNFSSKTVNIDEVIKSISLFASGQENWIEPELTLIDNANDGEFNTNKKEVQFTFQLDYDADALVNYNQEFLLTKYNTTHPLVRFEFDVSNETGYEFYKLLAENTLNEITINTDVQGITSVAIENDNGSLKSNKPFTPFTTRPIIGSNFTINYEEAFSKEWTEFTVNLRWKNVPEDLKTWYAAYMKSTSYSSINGYASLLGKTISENEDNLIVSGPEYFKIEKRLLHAGGVSKETEGAIINLFERETIIDGENVEITYSSIITTQNVANSYGIDKAGPLQLSLEQSFLHELYPKLYALAVSSQSKTINLPNEPYTPLIEGISVGYVAEESLVMSEAAKSDNRIQLFHEHAFGQSEENYAIKKYLQEEKNIIDVFDKDTIQTVLVPRYCLGGHLYIGLEEVVNQQSVALLIQVLEGSENPLTDSFTDTEKVLWSVLCNNKWKSLEDSIISNDADNFLKSGIFKFTIPREATSDNTLLPEGYVWIKAQMNKSFDAVCQAIDIHAQAVLASFENNNNEVSHLKDGLPAGTIKKMVTRIPQVKGISQPYNAFGGSPEETDEKFYRRISERLRHKNRAITLWDYEHIILQEFPEIYKVKCLNHTSETSFTSAGNVTIVVVPDTVNKNVFDIYQPRVSMALLNKIKAHVNALNTLHVEANIINPNYEEVAIGLEAKFYDGYDENFYKEQLKTDITKFLSPWAFDDTKEVTFGIALHKSVLIDYIEKLPYVDYLQNVTMNGDANIYKIVPSDPKSILVSAKEHSVSTVLTTCKGTKTIIEPVCQL